jgi:hypothetical protein
MARTLKIDNASQKRFAQQQQHARKVKKLVSYFLIVCEGSKTEPNYFKSFPKEIGGVVYDVKLGGDGGINTLGVVEKAIELRDNSSQQYDRVWAVFDKDSFPANHFNSAIQKAKANDIHCAWSNEAFELWYLLHFHDRITAMSRTEYERAIEAAVDKKNAEKATNKKGNKSKFPPFEYQKK